MKCKVIVNKDSGNSNKVNIDALKQYFGCELDIQYIGASDNWSAEGYDTIVVCGGDGTLHNALVKCHNKQLFYLPCGTLNEGARKGDISAIGKVNDQPFHYVCAAGSFTQIGYTANNKSKQKFKALAYLPKVFSSYHCHQIPATLKIDDQQHSGEYTLLMVIRSKCCFGFNFNKQFDKRPSLYMLAVKSCGKDNFVNKIRLFFPFFRIFFCGIGKPTQNKKWLLLPFSNATITLEKQHDFCFDGEKIVLQGKLSFCEQQLTKPIVVLQPSCFCHKKARKKLKKLVD